MTNADPTKAMSEEMQKQWELAQQLAASIVEKYRADAPEECDPQNTIAAAAFVGGAALVGSIGAGYMQAESQRKATNANRQNVKDTNALNYQMFRESRGEGGSSILPLYAPDGTEEKMFGGAVQVYDAITGQPVSMTLDQYNKIAASMRPSVQSGDALINAIYSGELEQQRMTALDPVLAARTRQAEANAAAVDLALAQEQNRIAAADAVKGYTGGGSFVGNRMLAATIAARQQAAQQRAAAELANAQEQQALKENMTNLKLQSINLPMERANALMDFSMAPYKGLVQRQAIAMQPFQFFKLNPGNPPQAQAFQQQADPSTGAIIASGVGQAAGAYMNYRQNQQLIDAMGKMGTKNPGVVNTGANVDFGGELNLGK